MLARVGAGERLEGYGGSMKKEKYIADFENLGFGLFVHFGVYSMIGKGEWHLHLDLTADKAQYHQLYKTFYVKENWAKELVAVAKSAGCKYITITSRHHDGFSLYDTCGLNDYDAPHSASKRDLIREFVDACNEGGVLPFFYHTLLDWYMESYEADFPRYIDYLISSVEILCKNYGKIGGFWFDGMWNKPNADWQEDRLYATIRKYQPEAMIINNTGLSELGKVGHPEIDSVTFERGNPAFVDNSDKYRAGEMCQVLNDHWGYTKDDCNYKSVKELVGNLIDCRKFGCNFLLNTGLRGDGSVNTMDACILAEIGKWTAKYGEAIYTTKPCEIKADNAVVLRGEDCYYALIHDVPMRGDPNVQRGAAATRVRIHAEILEAEWVDNGQKIEVEDNSFPALPFAYGASYSARVAKLKLK